MGRELAAAEAALGQVEVNCCICRGTHLAGAMFFFIDLQSEISGGATAWLALGVWINCIAVQCDATVKAIEAENIDQVVHVDHVRYCYAEFPDEFKATWKITTIVIGGGRACWKSLKKR